jgi:RNA polymerase sigma-70 factor (ECF subfamily)
VYGYGRRKGLQEAGASDLTQEVLAEVARCMPAFQYDPGRGRFRDWLGTLTRRRLIRHCERRQRHAGQTCRDADLEEAAAPEADPEWTAAFYQAVLEAALQRVRPRFEPATWTAFEQTWREGRPPADVSAELGLAPGTIYAAKSRALKALREMILDLSEDLPLASRLG